MYGYEGIGSIYWHQNSKLLVSIQEAYLAAHRNGNSDETALRNEYFLAVSASARSPTIGAHSRRMRIRIPRSAAAQGSPV